QEAVGRCALVALLLRRQLRRCTHRDHPPVHRTAADATLTAQRTPTASPLSFPGLKAEACRAPGQGMNAPRDDLAQYHFQRAALAVEPASISPSCLLVAQGGSPF